jgi:glycosyltransferase involved in cell wall biosynthesis
LTSGDRDGLPNVLMEAHSQGLAVVSTDVSGVPELVMNRETGLLVPPDDVRALAAALLTLIRDPAQRNAMGKAGEIRMHAMFDASVWLDRLAARFQPPRVPGDTAEAA